MNMEAADLCGFVAGVVCELGQIKFDERISRFESGFGSISYRSLHIIKDINPTALTLDSESHHSGDICTRFHEHIDLFRIYGSEELEVYALCNDDAVFRVYVFVVRHIACRSERIFERDFAFNPAHNRFGNIVRRNGFGMIETADFDLAVEHNVNAGDRFGSFAGIIGRQLESDGKNGIALGNGQRLEILISACGFVHDFFVSVVAFDGETQIHIRRGRTLHDDVSARVNEIVAFDHYIIAVCGNNARGRKFDVCGVGFVARAFCKREFVHSHKPVCFRHDRFGNAVERIVGYDREIISLSVTVIVAGCRNDGGRSVFADFFGRFGALFIIGSVEPDVGVRHRSAAHVLFHNGRDRSLSYDNVRDRERKLVRRFFDLEFNRLFESVELAVRRVRKFRDVSSRICGSSRAFGVFGFAAARISNGQSGFRALVSDGKRTSVISLFDFSVLLARDRNGNIRRFVGVIGYAGNGNACGNDRKHYANEDFCQFGFHNSLL